jgi:hypothetical protein
MFQSIIGATEKRRESGAGVAVIGGIGVSGMGEAGRWGVYQDWACGAQMSLAEVVERMSTGTGGIERLGTRPANWVSRFFFPFRFPCMAIGK